jgi:hypothetical protein
MKIAILSHKNVSALYAVTLMERGHQVIVVGPSPVPSTQFPLYLKCDGCLLLGEDSDLLAIAQFMGDRGKKLWLDLPEIPITSSRRTGARRLT